MKAEFLKWFHDRTSTPEGGRIIVGIGLTGMLLILLSELLPSGKTEDTHSTNRTDTMTLCEEQLEKRLSTLIGQMEGVGKVTVMVTLDSGEEVVYAVDEQEGDTGHRQTHILLEDGTALEEKVYLPQVRGVAVICEGAENAQIAAQITELLSALLEIPTHRIFVASHGS